MTIAFNHLPGGWRNYIEYARFAAQNGSRDMERICALYDAMEEHDQIVATPEMLCDRAQIQPSVLVAHVCGALWETHSTASNVISTIAHPRITRATVRWAEKEENFDDRELFFRMTGSLPDRKGTSIVVNNNPQAALVSPQGGFRREEVSDMDAEVVEVTRLLSQPAQTIDVRPQPEMEPVAVDDEDDEDEDDE